MQIDINPHDFKVINTPKPHARKNALPIFSYTGILQDAAKHTKERAMNKRLEKLAILDSSLKIKDISGFQVEHHRVGKDTQSFFLKSSNDKKIAVPVPKGTQREFISGEFTLFHSKKTGVNTYRLETDKQGHLQIAIISSSYSTLNTPLLPPSPPKTTTSSPMALYPAVTPLKRPFPGPAPTPKRAFPFSPLSP